MENTQEYQLGWGALAVQAGLEIKENGAYSHYTFPGTWENGWITQAHPAPGLFVASAWFTSTNVLDYTIRIPENFLLLLCIDTGSIRISRQGQATQLLTPFTRLVIGNGKPLRLRIAAGEHMCFTSLMIFESCIHRFLKANKVSFPIQIPDARNWTARHVDTPGVMLVMEQIRWGVRGNRLPLPAYLCKAIELLCLFAHNLARAEQGPPKRRHYVTWENEQKLYLVKATIDQDPLQAPGIEDLCLLAEMSESKLRIAFKSLYGKPLYAYTREAIMKRAMQLMGDDELNIKNIATRCGYENPAKFAAAFKAVHGITPSAFRKGFGL